MQVLQDVFFLYIFLTNASMFFSDPGLLFLIVQNKLLLFLIV